MRKLALTLVTASVAFALAGCSTAPDVTPTPTHEVPTELPEWADGAFEKGYSDHLLVSAGVEGLGEKLVYSAQTDEGDKCVIPLIPPPLDDPDGEWFGSAACGPAEQFAVDGIIAGFHGGGNRGSVHLLPPDYNKPLKPGWVRVSQQLAIRF